jgi:hypothetical protein
MLRMPKPVDNTGDSVVEHHDPAVGITRAIHTARHGAPRSCEYWGYAARADIGTDQASRTVVHNPQRYYLPYMISIEEEKKERNRREVPL